MLGWPPTSASAAALQVAALRSALDTANGTIAQPQNKALTKEVAALNGQLSDLNVPRLDFLRQRNIAAAGYSQRVGIAR